MLHFFKMLNPVFIDTIKDTLYLSIFLFFTYLILEYLEHHTKSKLYTSIQKTSKFGPFWGVLAGLTGGCGLSAAASNFYMARAITLGTLISIYLATSDEMLPLMISEGADYRTIASVVAFKTVFAFCVGFVIDFYIRQKKKQKLVFTDICKQENCQCKHNSIFKAAFIHTMRLTLFVFIITFILNCLMRQSDFMFLIGQMSKHKSCLVFTSAIIGLIPSCTISIGLTQLFIEGVLPIDALMAGLLSNAGVGLIVLYKLNHSFKEMVKICGILFIAGIIGGHLAGFLLGG